MFDDYLISDVLGNFIVAPGYVFILNSSRDTRTFVHVSSRDIKLGGHQRNAFCYIVVFNRLLHCNCVIVTE